MVWSRRTRFAALALAGVLALFGTACGGGDGDDDDRADAGETDGGATDEEATDEVEPPEDREDQDPGFEELEGEDDLDLRDVEDDDDDEDTDGETDGDGEETDDVTAVDEYEDYMEVEDDTGTLTLSVPEEWSDLITFAPLVDAQDNNLPGTGIIAAPDLDILFEYEVPGVTLAVTTDTVNQPIDGLLESNAGVFATDCTFESNEEYDDGFYVGQFDVYSDCSDTGAGIVVLAANAPDDDYVISLVGIVFTEADLVALDEIVVSSLYTGAD
jgi:hypothetical protein